MWNVFFDCLPVLINGSQMRPTLEVVPVFLMAEGRVSSKTPCLMRQAENGRAMR